MSIVRCHFHSMTCFKVNKKRFIVHISHPYHKRRHPATASVADVMQETDAQQWAGRAVTSAVTSVRPEEVGDTGHGQSRAVCGEQREDMADEKEKLIQETRKRFTQEYIQDSTSKYDSRDVERLQNDDAWVESYLLWRHNVVEEALKMIDESLRWRKEININDLSESVIPRWCFDVGATYLHGYDKEGNKLLWLRVKLHVRDNKTNEDKKKCVAFWLERYAKREPGKLLTVVFDMAECGLSNVDMDFVRFVINCFKIYYPRYLSKIVIFEMPWIMNAAFKIVKGWLGPEAINMLKFVNRNEIQDYVSAEYLPPHMGGTDPFKYSYPPLPDDDFQTPICENGPASCEDELESKEESEVDTRDTVDSITSEESALKPRKDFGASGGLREEERHDGV